jgi:hypothetical protein
MRVVLVTGTRDLRDPSPVYAELAKLAPDLVIHGDARGVDTAADSWAKANHADIISWAADWHPANDKYDSKAGIKRNTVLVRIAGKYLAAGHDVVCLAMPGPKSVGTHDCGRKAHKAGLRIVRVDVNQ